MGTTFQSALTRFLKETFGDGKGRINVWDDSPEETASRWIKAMQEFAPTEDPGFKETVFKSTVNQLITVCNIQYSSLCAHHLFPFWGVAHIGYIPNTLMIGVSKIPRIVEYLARRPNTQETLARSTASYLKNLTECHGVAVYMAAKHTCMACRGVRQHDAIMTTTEMRGVFLTADAARQEFLSVVSMQGRQQ